MTPVLDQMLRKVETRAALDDADRDALLGLSVELHTLDAATYLVRQGDRRTRTCLVASGFAFRQKLTSSGTRQILSVSIPGDFVDLDSALLDVADHNVQALTRCQVAFIPRTEIRMLIDQHPRVAVALWLDTLVDASIFQEWILNVGRRDARGRIAHLLCEFARRLEVAGLANGDSFQFPMTQEQLADATGLTAVHVNRTLRGLEKEGLIERDGRRLRIPDREALRDAADFSESYLHFDQASSRRKARPAA
jgi:CRP-like cAMP-binding protein